MYLVRPAKDKYDRDGYEMVSTGEFIRVINPECSYESTSSCSTTLRAYCIPEIRTGICINPCARDAAKAIYDDLNQYGYVMPFKEYVKNVLGINLVGPISLKKANVLLALINKRFGKFMLSYNKDNAQEQIDKKVRRKH